MQLAKDAGVPVFLDAGGVEGPISPQLLANIGVLSPNETELARLTGLPTDDEAQIQAAAAQLQVGRGRCGGGAWAVLRAPIKAQLQVRVVRKGGASRAVPAEAWGADPETCGDAGWRRVKRAGGVYVIVGEAVRGGTQTVPVLPRLRGKWLGGQRGPEQSSRGSRRRPVCTRGGSGSRCSAPWWWWGSVGGAQGQFPKAAARERGRGGGAGWGRGRHLVWCASHQPSGLAPVAHVFCTPCLGLQGLGVQSVLVKLGADGSLLLPGERRDFGRLLAWRRRGRVPARQAQHVGSSVCAWEKRDAALLRPRAVCRPQTTLRVCCGAQAGARRPSGNTRSARPRCVSFTVGAPLSAVFSL